ncbi:Sensor histidine kinase CitA [compost metagenome]
MDDALKPHLFEQGVTSKPQTNDELAGAEHGIGLYLVAGYVQGAGGNIEVTDNTPQGTLFSVFIPFETGGVHDAQPAA